MRSAGYHQANMLASQVLTEVKSVQEAVLQALQTHSLERNDEHIPPAEHSANSMSAGEEIQLEMLKAIKELRSEMNSLKQASKKNIYKKTKKGKRLQTSKYCWTHGGWSHRSADCKSKKTRHKDTATFRNKMGGSTE